MAKTTEKEKNEVLEIENNEVVEPVKRIGTLKSRLNYSQNVVYDNKIIVVSPQQEIKKVNESLLEFPLPAGIYFI